MLKSLLHGHIPTEGQTIPNTCGKITN